MSTEHRSLAVAMLAVGAACLLAASTGLGARASRTARVTGDEPQYLLSALSLAEDGDLDISDEIAARRYLRFHETRLDPQTVPIDDAGTELSPHDPLLAVLLAPAMAAGGWFGAKVTMAALAAAIAALTLWVAVRRFDVGIAVASVVVVALFASPPLVGYATQIYPELPAAGITMAGFAGLTAASGRRAALVCGAAVVALPWTAVKYVPIAVVLAAALLVRLGRSDRRAAMATLVALAAMTGAYLVVHQRVYGGWTAYAAGDHFVGGELEVVGASPDYVGRSQRSIGLLLDRGFGLFAWSPAYLAITAALVHLARRRPPGWAVLVAVVAAGWATATWIALTMHGWWWPGRQVVVVLPVVTVAVAVLVERVRPWLVPVAAGGLVGFASWAWLAWEASTGRRTLVVDFEATANPWYRLWRLALPDFRMPGAATFVLATAWVLTLAAAAWWGTRSEELG